MQLVVQRKEYVSKSAAAPPVDATMLSGSLSSCGVSGEDFMRICGSVNPICLEES